MKFFEKTAFGLKDVSRFAGALTGKTVKRVQGLKQKSLSHSIGRWNKLDAMESKALAAQGSARKITGAVAGAGLAGYGIGKMSSHEKIAVSGKYITKAINSRLKANKGLGSLEKTQKQLKNMMKSHTKDEFPLIGSLTSTEQGQALLAGNVKAHTQWGKTYNKVKRYL